MSAGLPRATLDDLREALMKPTDLNRMSRPVASRDPGPGRTYFPGTFPEDGTPILLDSRTPNR